MRLLIDNMMNILKFLLQYWFYSSFSLKTFACYIHKLFLQQLKSSSEPRKSKCKFQAPVFSKTILLDRNPGDVRDVIFQSRNSIQTKNWKNFGETLCSNTTKEVSLAQKGEAVNNCPLLASNYWHQDYISPISINTNNWLVQR